MCMVGRGVCSRGLAGIRTETSVWAGGGGGRMWWGEEELVGMWIGRKRRMSCPGRQAREG